ncbi:MAG TPA: hypothetical protein VFO39_22240 [Candidatus Sulfotelmatobacter sp.]|nr:hypothetical protein [Candidatus Sulfotelmatobacter sp.]
MKRVIWISMFMCATAIALAQAAQKTVYVESFRHGPAQVTETSFEVDLTGQNAAYKQSIKDSHGNERYLISILPQGPEGDSKITSWHVKLKDLHHNIYDNILLTTLQDSPDPKNNIGWLNPSRYAAVPIDAVRIMKVDSFYVVLQVTAYHFNPVDSPYLDSTTVEFKFLNTDPRTPQ